MKVHIKEKLFTYTSDFPDGWVFAKGDYFKKVNIDRYTCFVKRFEVKTPESISAWQLLLDLKGKYEDNLARLFDIAVSKENGRNIYYIFYEFIEGDTLHRLVADDIDVDLVRLTDSLFSGIASLQKRGYWFPDFVEKNIYFDKRGTFVLIDLDSAYPLSEAPNHDMWADKEYWALVFNFYKEILGRHQLDYSDLHGINLNYLIIIFLILRLKIHQSGRKKEFHSLFNDLPIQLDRVSRSFRKIFEDVFQKQTAISPDIIKEIRNLVEDKILSLTNKAIPGLIEGWPDPVIKYFSADKDTVSPGEPFNLKWGTENIIKVEIFKNGKSYHLSENATDTIRILEEVAESGDKPIEYTIVASGYSESAEPQSLYVTVKNLQPVKTVIHSFAAVGYDNKIGDDHFEMNKITGFSLVWKTEHASVVELYKNGILYKKMNPGEEQVRFADGVDIRDKDVKFTLKAYNNPSLEQSRSLVVTFTSPGIKSFIANKQSVRSGETFTLRWQVQHATSVELFRNGLSYRSFGPTENSLQLKESFSNSSNAAMEYILLVSDGHSNVTSEPVIIALKASKKLRPSIFKIAMVALAFCLLAELLYLLTWQKGHVNLATEIAPFTPDLITEHNTITITGKNIPLDKDAVQVEFANVKGNIIRQTKDSLLVQVPSIAKSNKDVEIKVLVNGVSFNASDHVRYMVMSSRDVYSPGFVENLVDKIKPKLIQYSNRKIRLQLDNGSSLDLNKVVVVVSYVSNLSEVVNNNQVPSPKRESLIFTDMQAGASRQLDAPYLDHASEVEVRIKTVDVKKA